MRLPRPHVLLKKAFRAKQKSSPSCSLRWLSSKLGVSHTYLSRVMNGEKAFPQHHLKNLIDLLEIDSSSQEILHRSLLQEITSKSPEASSLIRTLLSEKSPSGIERLERYQEVQQRTEYLHDIWYHVALLDLVTCADFREDLKWIAQRLGLTESQVKSALHYLEFKGYLQRENGRLVKSESKIRFPTSRSHPTIRNYHTLMAKKAIRELEKAKQEDFEKRLMMGVSFAANPANFARARERMTAALYEIAEILAEGDCTEVYQLNGHLFPLTKGVKK